MSQKKTVAKQTNLIPPVCNHHGREKHYIHFVAYDHVDLEYLFSAHATDKD